MLICTFTEFVKCFFEGFGTGIIFVFVCFFFGFIWRNLSAKNKSITVERGAR